MLVRVCVLACINLAGAASGIFLEVRHSLRRTENMPAGCKLENGNCFCRRTILGNIVGYTNL